MLAYLVGSTATKKKYVYHILKNIQITRICLFRCVMSAFLAALVLAKICLKNKKKINLEKRRKNKKITLNKKHKYLFLWKYKKKCSNEEHVSPQKKSCKRIQIKEVFGHRAVVSFESRACCVRRFFDLSKVEKKRIYI